MPLVEVNSDSNRQLLASLYASYLVTRLLKGYVA
jgi:hypothetical protein